MNIPYQTMRRHLKANGWTVQEGPNTKLRHRYMPGIEFETYIWHAPEPIGYKDGTSQATFFLPLDEDSPAYQDFQDFLLRALAWLLAHKRTDYKAALAEGSRAADRYLGHRVWWIRAEILGIDFGLESIDRAFEEELRDVSAPDLLLEVMWLRNERERLLELNTATKKQNRTLKQLEEVQRELVGQQEALILKLREEESAPDDIDGCGGG